MSEPITTIEELEALRNGVTIDTNGRSIQITGDLVFDETTHIRTYGGDIRTNGGNIHTHGGAIATHGGDIRTLGGAIRIHGGLSIQTDGGDIYTEGGNIHTHGGTIYTRGGGIVTDGGDIYTGGGYISTRGGAIDTGGGTLNGRIPPHIEDQIKLLDTIRDRVVKNPECLNMSRWHCGTAHCLAGHAQVIMDGEETDRAYDAGVEYIPIAISMFFKSNGRVLKWLRDREYANQ